MDKIDRVKKKIEEIIKKSSVPEDPIHSKNTLQWLLKLKPDADEALRIAALGHDIERAIEERKVKREDYESYDEFKSSHALNSANILKEIMDAYNIQKELTDDVFFLVSHHEIGGTKRADLLKNADTLSFFQVNLPHYFNRNGEEETERRFLWGYNKLPKSLKKIVNEFHYQNKELDSRVRVWIKKADGALLDTN